MLFIKHDFLALVLQKLRAAAVLVALMSASASAQENFAAELQAGIDDGSLQGLHSVISMADGEPVASAYFVGEDEQWGVSLGRVEHSAETQHDIRSVTKSIVGLLYAIARDEGLVPEPSAGLYAQFPEYPELAADSARQKIRIEHALSMTMGTAWDESLPYTDPKNSEIAMEYADDRYRYILQQAITDEPGERWNYSGGAAALVGKIISRAAGKPLHAYAAERLFKPLAISDYTWIQGEDGESSAASGLRLRAPDLAKIGQLVADAGRYKGQRIVSEQALERMLQPRVAIEPNFQYGHFWYLLGPGERPAVVAAFGNGGQRLSVNLKRKLVTVVFAGNYNQPDAWRLPITVIDEHIVPALRQAGKL